MISLEQFKKECDSKEACGGCEIYRRCLHIRKKFHSENDYNKDYQKFVYEKFVSIWRKQKLAKLLS